MDPLALVNWEGVGYVGDDSTPGPGKMGVDSLVCGVLKDLEPS